MLARRPGSLTDAMSVDTETSVTDQPTPEGDGDLVLTVTPEALTKVIEIRDAEDDPGTLGLRVEILGANGSEYAYDLGFEPVSDAEEEDHVSVQGGLTVVVPVASIKNLRGATLDLPTSPGQGGLVIRNPNRPSAASGLVDPDLELTGDIADKVQQLLDKSINPGLASHGGFAELKGVEGTVVHLSMGGGCQGCAMSAATLREGIQVAIREMIPEVTEIIDVTDHDAGESPYFT